MGRRFPSLRDDAQTARGSSAAATTTRFRCFDAEGKQLWALSTTCGSPLSMQYRDETVYIVTDDGFSRGARRLAGRRRARARERVEGAIGHARTEARRRGGRREHARREHPARWGDGRVWSSASKTRGKAPRTRAERRVQERLVRAVSSGHPRGGARSTSSTRCSSRTQGGFYRAPRQTSVASKSERSRRDRRAADHTAATLDANDQRLPGGERELSDRIAAPTMVARARSAAASRRQRRRTRTSSRTRPRGPAWGAPIRARWAPASLDQRFDRSARGPRSSGSRGERAALVREQRPARARLCEGAWRAERWAPSGSGVEAGGSRFRSSCDANEPIAGRERARALSTPLARYHGKWRLGLLGASPPTM
jgi:hypothetical protein